MSPSKPATSFVSIARMLKDNHEIWLGPGEEKVQAPPVDFQHVQMQPRDVLVKVMQRAPPKPPIDSNRWLAALRDDASASSDSPHVLRTKFSRASALHLSTFYTW